MIRRLHLIANPRGGVGDNVALAKRASAFLARRGIQTCLHLTEYAGHARELAARLDVQAGHGLCGIGGDGTMHELVNGIMQREDSVAVPMTLLPGGTGNALLNDLDCLDPEAVLERIAVGARRAVDLFEVRVGNDRHFGFNLVGWGLFSAANRLAERLRVFGRRRYDIAGLWKILGKRIYRGVLEIETGTVEGGFTLVAAGNTRHTGAGMLFAPGAKLDDGQLDLIYLRQMSRMSLMRLFMKLRTGGHVGQPGVHLVHVKRFRLSTDEDLPVNLDGELIAGGTFEVRVRPGALQLML